MKTEPTQRDLRRRKINEDDRTLMSIRYLFEPVKVYKTKYVNKKGETIYYDNKQIDRSKQKRNLTPEEIDFVKRHSANEIAKHFGKSTTWAYSRIAGNYTI